MPFNWGCSFQKTKHAEYNAKKVWLGDPATYPLFVVMGAASFLVVGVISSCLLASPDVQISPKKRNQIIRTWGLPGYKHNDE